MNIFRVCFSNRGGGCCYHPTTNQLLTYLEPILGFPEHCTDFTYTQYICLSAYGILNMLYVYPFRSRVRLDRLIGNYHYS